MSRGGECDRCGGSTPDHEASHGRGYACRSYTCRADDELRRLRAARHEGTGPLVGYHRGWVNPENVDKCVYPGCLLGPHGLGWSRPHEYEPPPAAELLRRMRERRARRIERRVKARGTWDTRSVFHVWLDEHVCDDWDVTRTYGDLYTAVSVTRDLLGISKFTAPDPVTPREWSLYSDEHGVTAMIGRSVVGTLVRP